MPQAPKNTPPPLRDVALSVTLRGLAVRVPPVIVAVLLAGIAPVIVMKQTPPPPPTPNPAIPQDADEQGSTVDVGAMYALASVLPGRLPNPGPNQKRAGQCIEGLEVEINGGCWVATDKKPPCPPPRGGYTLYEHEGKCWMPMARAARTPTSGEPRGTLTVADPP